MLTSPSCKWWISLAFYRSNGLDVAIIETLHGRTALKNGSFWTLLSSYIGWPPSMKWTKWGMWYADISLLQMIDNPSRFMGPTVLTWQVFLIWDCLSVAIKCIYYSSCNLFPSTVQLSVRMYFASAFILFFLVVICYNRVLPCTSFC